MQRSLQQERLLAQAVPTEVEPIQRGPERTQITITVKDGLTDGNPFGDRTGDTVGDRDDNIFIAPRDGQELTYKDAGSTITVVPGVEIPLSNPGRGVVSSLPVGEIFTDPKYADGELVNLELRPQDAQYFKGGAAFITSPIEGNSVEVRFETRNGVSPGLSDGETTVAPNSGGTSTSVREHRPGDQMMDGAGLTVRQSKLQDLRQDGSASETTTSEAISGGGATTTTSGGGVSTTTSQSLETKTLLQTVTTPVTVETQRPIDRTVIDERDASRTFKVTESDKQDLETPPVDPDYIPPATSARTEDRERNPIMGPDGQQGAVHNQVDDRMSGAQVSVSSNGELKASGMVQLNPIDDDRAARDAEYREFIGEGHQPAISVVGSITGRPGAADGTPTISATAGVRLTTGHLVTEDKLTQTVDEDGRVTSQTEGPDDQADLDPVSSQVKKGPTNIELFAEVGLAVDIGNVGNTTTTTTYTQDGKEQQRVRETGSETLQAPGKLDQTFGVTQTELVSRQTTTVDPTVQTTTVDPTVKTTTSTSTTTNFQRTGTSIDGKDYFNDWQQGGQSTSTSTSSEVVNTGSVTSSTVSNGSTTTTETGRTTLSTGAALLGQNITLTGDAKVVASIVTGRENIGAANFVPSGDPRITDVDVDKKTSLAASVGAYVDVGVNWTPDKYGFSRDATIVTLGYTDNFGVSDNYNEDAQPGRVYGRVRDGFGGDRVIAMEAVQDPSTKEWNYQPVPKKDGEGNVVYSDKLDPQGKPIPEWETVPVGNATGFYEVRVDFTPDTGDARAQLRLGLQI